MKLHWGYVVLIAAAAAVLAYGFATKWTFKTM